MMVELKAALAGIKLVVSFAKLRATMATFNAVPPFRFASVGVTPRDPEVDVASTVRAADSVLT